MKKVGNASQWKKRDKVDKKSNYQGPKKKGFERAMKA